MLFYLLRNIVLATFSWSWMGKWFPRVWLTVTFDSSLSCFLCVAVRGSISCLAVLRGSPFKKWHVISYQLPNSWSSDCWLMPLHGLNNKPHTEAHLRATINVRCKYSYRQNKLSIFLPRLHLHVSLFCVPICMGLTKWSNCTFSTRKLNKGLHWQAESRSAPDTFRDRWFAQSSRWP